MITDHASCTREVKFNNDMPKSEFNRKKTLFTSKLNLNLREKLVKFHIYSMAFMMLKLGHFGK